MFVQWRKSGAFKRFCRPANLVQSRYNELSKKSEFRWRTNGDREMPKISDIEETPNPNAVKFILREAVSNGTAQSFSSASQAENDALAKSLFDVGHVVSVFYMDRMITVEKDDEGDWDELLPALAVPIRAAASVASGNAAAAAVGGAMAAITSDDPRLMKINDILDEKVRPALMGDGGYLEVLGLQDNTLSIRYQGACGSCPSSLTGTLMAIESMLKQEIDPDLEVIAV
jgi:NFU1 iron-sulfur cluster scaffold homolog, mitochondrial